MARGAWETPISRWRLENNGLDMYGISDATMSNVVYTSVILKEGFYSAEFANGRDMDTNLVLVNGDRPYTWTMWFRTGTKAKNLLISSLILNGAYTGWMARVENTSGFLRVFNGSGWGYVGSVDVSDDNWHHVAFIKNASRMLVYLDTVKLLDYSVGASESVVEYLISDSLLRVPLAMNNFDGEIDDIRYYDVELTQNDINNLRDSYDDQWRWNYMSRWKFDTDATDINGVNDGTASNVTYSTSRVDGQGSAAFNGSTSKVLLDTYADVFQYPNFSICAWVKVTADGDIKTVYAEGATGNDNTELSFRVGADEKMYVYIRKADTTVLLNDGGNIVLDDRWHHVVYTDANGTAVVYVDGVADAGFSGSYVRASVGANTSVIGAYTQQSGDTYHYNGLVDDVRIYPIVLSAANVKSLYQSYFAATPLNLGANL